MGGVWKWTRGARGVQRQHKRVSRRAERRAGRLVLLLGAAPPAPHACFSFRRPHAPPRAHWGALACWCEPSPGAPAGRATPASGTGHSGHSIPVALLLGSWDRQRGAHSHPWLMVFALGGLSSGIPRPGRRKLPALWPTDVTPAHSGQSGNQAVTPAASSPRRPGRRPLPAFLTRASGNRGPARRSQPWP